MKLSFILVVILYADHTLPIEGRCTNGEIFPDSSDVSCQRYFLCNKGQLIKQTCFRDFIYSKTINTCVPPFSFYNDCQVFKHTAKTKKPYAKEATTTIRTPVTTKTTTTVTPKTSTTTTKTSDQTTTKMAPGTTTTKKTTSGGGYTTKTTKRPYYYSTSGYTTKPKKRPPFPLDIASVEITPGPVSISTTETDICIPGETFPVWNNCYSYYYCSNGKLEKRTCVFHFVYSKKMKRCVPQYSKHADCNSHIPRSF